MRNRKNRPTERENDRDAKMGKTDEMDGEESPPLIGKMGWRKRIRINHKDL